MAKGTRTGQLGPPLGTQPPRYRFFLNPYTDVRFTTCPQCRGKTSQRQLPLVIHIDPMQLVALNKTCRYCPHCDLLIAHQDQLEAWLTAFFTERRPEIVGNDYLVLGTKDRANWLRGVRTRCFRKRLLSTCAISARWCGSPRHRDGCGNDRRARA